MPKAESIANPAANEPVVEDRNLVHLALIIIVGIFATTLAQPQVLGKLPLQHLLKSELHVSKTEMASFFFLCGLFWYLKPFAGILTDAFPLMGTRRRSYLLISGVLACLSWLALSQVPHTYKALLIGCIVINLFMVMMSTVIGAYLVEAGQQLTATGRLSSVRQIVQSLCGMIQGPLAGLLASGAFAVAAGANAAVVISIVPIAFIFLREHKRRVDSGEAVKMALEQLSIIIRSGVLWAALGFILLYYFSPGFGTPLYYKQNDELHFSQQQIGNLGAFGGGFGILGAALYGIFIRKLNIRVLLTAGVVLSAGGTLLYLFYDNYFHAQLIESQNGFFGAFAEVALMDLAARSTPKGCEGLGYSLILSMRNVAIFGADIIGSKLSDAKWPFSHLVYLNAGTTALVLIFIPFLPLVVMRRKDTAA